jgi:hypothetical protein
MEFVREKESENKVRIGRKMAFVAIAFVLREKVC